MTTMILISSVAMLVGIVGSFFIWRLDASRAEEVKHRPLTVAPVAISMEAAKTRGEIGSR